MTTLSSEMMGQQPAHTDSGRRHVACEARQPVGGTRVESPPQQDVYPDTGRDDIAPFIPVDARSALEVGCGRGGFGRTLRSRLGPEARLVAVEAVASQAAV